MYLIWLVGSAALRIKSYYAAQTDNFILFLVCIFISDIFALVARKER